MGGDIASIVTVDESGKAVSMDEDGSRIAVGAPKHDGGRGTVRIYDWNDDSSSWVQIGLDIDGETADDRSGKSVSLSADGSRVAISAPGNDDDGADSGHARLYVASCSPETTSYTSGSTSYTMVAFKDVGTCSWEIPNGVTTFDWLVVGGGGGAVRGTAPAVVPAA
ncbi:MAG: hypothetical protein ACO38K_05280 [Ilumatobacteraceae bacterium]